jgi:uroporphyrin-III C-methyltransferase/precorrin-2 dehydrogenase/sirohydrochlorin ferrochelatase
MNFLPVFMDVRGKPCLLVGEGDTAERKMRLLIKAGAHVRRAGESFTVEDLDGVALVIAASSDDALNQRVSHLAQAVSIPVNVVDKPDLCTFIFPAIIERGDITVAVSSGGTVPVLTRLLRARIETFLPASLGDFSALAGSFRQQIKQKIPDMQLRLRFWDGLLQSQMIGADGDLAAHLSESKMIKKLTDFSRESHAGCIFIVGAGPGDPDLLTFKALRCLQACDAVIFDTQTIDIRIVDLARRDALRIEIHSSLDAYATLKSLAEKNQAIVYLKAGDPLSYRDMPQLLARLQADNISAALIPGIIDQSAMQEFFAS